MAVLTRPKIFLKQEDPAEVRPRARAIRFFRAADLLLTTQPQHQDHGAGADPSQPLLRLLLGLTPGNLLLDSSRLWKGTNRRRSPDALVA